MLIPYLSAYFILKELLENASHLAGVESDLLITWGIVALVGLILGLTTLYIGGMCSHIAAYRIVYGLRSTLTAYIGTLPLGYLDSKATGTVKKTLETDVEKIETFIAHQLPDMVNVLVTIVALLCAMFVLDWRLALCCLVPIVLAFLFQMSMMMGDKAKKSLVGYYDALESMSASAIQYVRGLPVVKIFGQTVTSFRKFYQDMIDYRDFCIAYGENFRTGFILFKVVLGSLVSFVLPLGVLLLSKNPDSIDFATALLFFLVMGPAIAAPMYKANNLGAQFQEITEGVNRIDAILCEKPIDEPDSSQASIPDRFDIEFDEVSFAYSGEAPNAVSEISLHLREHELCALVGPSGSGKSTIAQLVPRFWDVDQGTIRIGGVDIRNIATENLMNIVAFVFQDSFLFYDSIRENIRFGQPQATDEEIIAAAKAAQCHDFIEALPQSYDTIIGSEGIYLSGGEVQRITIARAILKNAPILILDEATAFADPENEYQIQLALSKLIENKTTLVIAHRLYSIIDADQIVVLESGTICQKGTHDELVSQGGLYRKLWDIFSSAGTWEIDRREAQHEVTQ